MNSKTISEKEYTFNPKRILATDHFVSNDDIKSGFNNNDLVIGGSGTGKTGGYVIPNIRQKFGSMVVSDTKGRLYKTLAPELRKSGYKIHVLDFVNPQHSMGYNPLAFISKNKIKGSENEYCDKDIASIAKILLPETYNNDVFWIEAARSVVSFLIAFTLEALDEEYHNMKGVIEVYKLLQNKKGRDFMQNWASDNPDTFAAEQFELFSETFSADRTWGCISQFVSNAISPFSYEAFQTIFSARKNNLDIAKLGKTKSVLFINISDTDRNCDFIISILYTQILQQLCNEADRFKDGRLPVPVRIILDDFAAGVYIGDFDKIISIIRSRNISTSVILQNLSQLSSMYPHGRAETIISNCDHILYLGGQDIETAKYVGTRANRTCDNILKMENGKAYLIERGQTGILVDKVTPYSDEVYTA